MNPDNQTDAPIAVTTGAYNLVNQMLITKLFELSGSKHKQGLMIDTTKPSNLETRTYHSDLSSKRYFSQASNCSSSRSKT